MGLLEALRIRPREIKQSQSMAVSLLLYMGQETIWMTKDLEAYAKEGYMACQDAYACIEAIAKAVESLPIILFRGEGDKTVEVKEHPLLTLMRRPNPREGQTKFMGSFARFLLIAGNSYAEAAGPTTGPPRELYILKPHRTSIIKGNATQPIKGYRYRASGGKADFDAEDILHMRTFHPTDDWYGLAPIEVAARGIDISNLGMKWNAKLLTNDMRPSGGFIFDKPLVGDSRELFKKDIRETQQGTGGNFLILDNVKDFKQMSISSKEGDWTNLDKLTTRKICRVFNIAPEIIGDSENKTYSNYQEARLALYLDTAIPLMLWILDEFNTWLAPKFSAPESTERLRLAVDIDNVDALQEQRDKAWTRMGGAWFLKFNEKRTACGYAPVKEPIGEMYHLPVGLIETDGSENAEDEGDEGDEGGGAGTAKKKLRGKTHKGNGLWGDVKKRKQLWLAFEGRVKGREKSYDKLAEAYLKRQAGEIRARILAASSLSELRADALLDMDAEVRLYERKFWGWYVDHFMRAGNAGILASKGEIMDDGEMTSALGPGEQKDKPTSWVFRMTDEQEAKLRDMVLNSGTKVNQTTVQSILEKLLQANADNLTVNKFGQDIYDMVSDFPRWRGQLWSRTESAKVDNYGELEGYKETEFVEQKGWGCSFVPESRDTHIAADGQVRELDEDYDIGGKLMMFPGDPKGGAENCCNCLCFQYPIVGTP
jgi:HK97 family phage portal protein